jgi:hypothetical protein
VNTRDAKCARLKDGNRARLSGISSKCGDARFVAIPIDIDEVVERILRLDGGRFSGLVVRELAECPGSSTPILCDVWCPV